MEPHEELRQHLRSLPRPDKIEEQEQPQNEIQWNLKPQKVKPSAAS